MNTQRIRENLEISGKTIIVGNYKFKTEKIDTISTKAQLTAIAFLIRAVLINHIPCVDIYEQMKQIYVRISREGFGFLYTSKFPLESDMELPNIQDVLFALSRIQQGEWITEMLDDDIVEAKTYMS